MKKLFSLLAVLAIFALSGCTDTPTSALNKDQQNTAEQQTVYQNVQPVPKFDWSQYRQTIIDFETAQVNGVATTSFMMNYGVDPVTWCPSIGFAVPTTSQLTNPDQVTHESGLSGGGSVVVAQEEPNGSYTGNSSGTAVVCVAPNGAKYIVYAEGNVFTIGGPAHWDYTKHVAVLDGDPTVLSTQKKK